MAKFYGEIGYGETVETFEGSGVWVDQITERKYYGDITRPARQSQPGELLNNDLTVTNEISIVADAYLNQHFFAIRYVRWSGTLWTVPEVTVQAPRLTLRLGGVYNGPTPDPAPATP